MVTGLLWEYENLSLIPRTHKNKTKQTDKQILVMVARTCNPSVEEAETERSLWLWASQFILVRELQVLVRDPTSKTKMITLEE